MTDSYIDRKKKSEAAEKQKTQIVFGLMGGPFLIVFGLLSRWPVYKSLNLDILVSSLLIICGFILLLLGVVAPSLLNSPFKAFRWFGKTVGGIVITILLTAIYGVFIIPATPFYRRKRKTFRFIKWKGDFPDEDESSFVHISDRKRELGVYVRFPVLRGLRQLFATLIRNENYYLIPVTVLLVLIGLVLFFAASNIVFNFFIYTLF